MRIINTYLGNSTSEAADIIGMYGQVEILQLVDDMDEHGVFYWVIKYQMIGSGGNGNWNYAICSKKVAFGCINSKRKEFGLKDLIIPE